MDVVLGKELQHSCRVSSRLHEHGGQQGITIDVRPLRLESKQEVCYKNQQDLWPTGGGLICIQINSPVPLLLQLAARSFGKMTDTFQQNWSGIKGFASPPGT